jgi:hypothetical protein
MKTTAIIGVSGALLLGGLIAICDLSEIAAGNLPETAVGTCTLLDGTPCPGPLVNRRVKKEPTLQATLQASPKTAQNSSSALPPGCRSLNDYVSCATEPDVPATEPDVPTSEPYVPVVKPQVTEPDAPPVKREWWKIDRENGYGVLEEIPEGCHLNDFSPADVYEIDKIFLQARQKVIDKYDERMPKIIDKGDEVDVQSVAANGSKVVQHYFRTQKACLAAVSAIKDAEARKKAEHDKDPEQIMLNKYR